MPTVQQITNAILSEFDTEEHRHLRPGFERAAVKVAELFDDHGQTLVAAAALENEVTSTLLDMTVATVLATLIEEEGTGRCNIDYSPMSMDHMMQHYVLETSNNGLVRTVRIKLREDSNLNDVENWRLPSNRHGVVDVADTTYKPDDLKPQAEPKVHDRPVWAVRRHGGLDQADDEEMAQMSDRILHMKDGKIVE